MVVTEALARGVPVIASDVGGVREALGRRRRVLVPPGDRGRGPRGGAAAVADRRRRTEPAAGGRRAAPYDAGGLDAHRGAGRAVRSTRRWPVTATWRSWLRRRWRSSLLVVLVGLGPEPFARRRCGPDRSGGAGARPGRHRGDHACAVPGGGGCSRGGLGVEVPLRDAVAAYYRSQFLNATLPGGVVGDVHRAVRHGRCRSCADRGVRPGRAGRRRPGCRPAPSAPWPGCRGRGRRACARRRAWLGGARLRWPAGCVAASLLSRPRAARARLPGRGRAPPAPTRRSPSCCRWRCWCCSPRRSRSTSPAGGRARGWPRGRSRPPGSAPRRARRSPCLYGVLALVATLPGAPLLGRSVRPRRPSTPRPGGGAHG